MVIKRMIITTTKSRAKVLITVMRKWKIWYTMGSAQRAHTSVKVAQFRH